MKMDATRFKTDIFNWVKQHGVMPHIVESLLGHVYNAGSAEFNYNLSQYIPFKLKALNDWLECLEKWLKINNM